MSYAQLSIQVADLLSNKGLHLVKSTGTNDDYPEQTRCVDDYRIVVETVIDTGEQVLLVSFFAGDPFTPNFWGVPKGEVGLRELPDEAALRVARDSTNLRVELTEPSILGTRTEQVEKDGRTYYRLIYTYAVGVLSDESDKVLEGFKLGNGYVWYEWLSRGSKEIFDPEFNSINPSLRSIIAAFIGTRMDS